MSNQPDLLPHPDAAKEALESACQSIAEKNSSGVPALQKKLITKLCGLKSGDRNTAQNAGWIENSFEEISHFLDASRQFVGSVHAVRLLALTETKDWPIGRICNTDVKKDRQLHRLIRDCLCCVYCFQGVLDDEEGYHGWTDDHLIPGSLGGTNDDWNLVTCCHVCNSLRGNWVPADSASWGSRKAFIAAVRHFIEQRRAGEKAEFSRVANNDSIKAERKRLCAARYSNAIGNGVNGGDTPEASLNRQRDDIW